jgi:hypothetical protein
MKILMCIKLYYHPPLFMYGIVLMIKRVLHETIILISCSKWWYLKHVYKVYKSTTYSTGCQSIYWQWKLFMYAILIIKLHYTYFNNNNNKIKLIFILCTKLNTPWFCYDILVLILLQTHHIVNTECFEYKTVE